MNPLSQLIRNCSSPLDPAPAGESPQLQTLDGIRAVVFDIYGTLIISAAGDISLADETGHDDAIRSAIESAGLNLSADALGLSAAFHDHVRQAQAARRDKAGIEFPEVEIREVWRELLNDLAASDDLTGEFEDPSTIEQIAVAFECAANPVWPMPGLSETVSRLREEEIDLGIVSNAQFYTPLMFPAFLHEDLEGLGFARELQVYSFEHREGKPSPRLYEVLARNLGKISIQPVETLYVGNDLLKDIWPAGKTGFRTALFAGDRRSLRWREDDSRVDGISPDLVITELSQIPDCVA